jgi:predicted ribosome quality control (RQC) complex YloA/Tae2 family protein
MRGRGHTEGLKMPIDAPVIAGLATEIFNRLPVKIDKIHQPYPDEFLFSCFGGGESFKLLFSLNAKYGRFQICQGDKHNPLTPSAFCMLLRKHFGGTKLMKVTAVPFERIAQFTFEGYDPLTGLTHKNLWLELTGKSTNLIITNADGKIIDTWRKIHPRPGERDLNNGFPYQLPTKGGRWLPPTIDGEYFFALLASLPSNVTLERFFPAHWYGLSGVAVREIICRAGLQPEQIGMELNPEAAQQLYKAFSEWSTAVAQGTRQPTGIFDLSGNLLDFTAFPILFPPEATRVKPLHSLNEAIVTLLESQHKTARFREAQQNLLRMVKSQIEKNRKKLKKQQAEAAQAEKGDQWRICGELLTCYGLKTSKGQLECSLPNYYDPENREWVIKLNPALTAQENAQNYFKKYQKAKKGQLAIASQIAKTNETIVYLESLESLVDNALSLSDLEMAREEVGLVSKQRHQHQTKVKKSPKTKPERNVKPRQFFSPAGHQLLVGRNNIQNDRLTFKVAGPNDIWFHTQKIPGSHVILKAQPGVAIDDESLYYACQLAVYFSKGRPSTKVPVDYTQRKNVKKPPAAKPGFVIYDYFKTAIITPDQDLLTKLGLPEQ